MCWCFCEWDGCELCMSVTMNIVLLLGLFIIVIDNNMGVVVDQIGIFNFILISTNTILVSLELNSFRGKSVKKWNLVMRIIWTLVVGLIVILYLIQLISCTHRGRNACLIWEMGHGDEYLSVFFYELFFSICLLIVGPMFLYGIFKSFLLHKVLKSQYTQFLSTRNALMRNDQLNLELLETETH